ncbi:MAG: hypothetical protein ABIK65_14465 [Candidatus Eisenbacteria bacterium]
MRRDCLLVAGLALFLAASASASAFAAGEAPADRPPFVQGRLDVRYRAWTVEKKDGPDAKVSEVAFPLFMKKSLGASADLSILLPAFSASYDGDERSDLSGLADAVLTGEYRFDGGRYRAALTLGLPTGAVPFGPDEETIAGAATNRVLGFPVKRFGEGFDAGISLTRGFSPVRGLAASAGIGYVRKGEYDFAEDEGPATAYKPGNELLASAGAESEWDLGFAGVLASVDVRYRSFSKDERGGEAFYEEGDQIETLLGAGLLLPSGGRVDLQGFLVFKGDGSEQGAFGAGSIDSLSLERYLLRGMTGGYTRVSLDYAHPSSERIGLIAGAALHRFGEYPAPAGAPVDERLLGSATVWEVGGGARVVLSRHHDLSLRAAWLTGDAEEGDVDLAGFDVRTALRWTY